MGGAGAGDIRLRALLCSRPSSFIAMCDGKNGCSRPGTAGPHALNSTCQSLWVFLQTKGLQEGYALCLLYFSISKMDVAYLARVTESLCFLSEFTREWRLCELLYPPS